MTGRVLSAEEVREIGERWGRQEPVRFAYATDIPDLIATIEALREVVEVVESIARYPADDPDRATDDGYPAEVVYDEFAYKRMVDSYRGALNAAIDAMTEPR